MVALFFILCGCADWKAVEHCLYNNFLTNDDAKHHPACEIERSETSNAEAQRKWGVVFHDKGICISFDCSFGMRTKLRKTVDFHLPIN